MDDNIIRFSEKELVLLGSLNAEKTQIDFNGCIFNLKASFPLTLTDKALQICQQLSQKNQISLFVQHRDRVSVWIEG